MFIFVGTGYTDRNFMIFSAQMREHLPKSEIIATFEDEIVFSHADVFLQPRENHIFSDDDSGGADPDPDVIHSSKNQLRE